MNKETGGAAFPQPINPGEYGRGMTLRDYFAAKAMQSLLTSIEAGNEHQVSLIPNIAYEMADAMLKERGT